MFTATFATVLLFAAADAIKMKSEITSLSAEDNQDASSIQGTVPAAASAQTIVEPDIDYDNYQYQQVKWFQPTARDYESTTSQVASEAVTNWITEEQSTLKAFRDSVFRHAVAALEDQRPLGAVCDPGSECHKNLLAEAEKKVDEQWKNWVKKTVDDINLQVNIVETEVDGYWTQMEQCDDGCTPDCEDSEEAFNIAIANIEIFNKKIESTVNYLKKLEVERKEIIEKCPESTIWSNVQQAPQEFVTFMQTYEQEFAWESSYGITHGNSWGDL